jgi:hypothetical protein
MLARVLDRVRHLARTRSCAIRWRAARWLRPATARSLVLGAAADPVRGKPELVAENALLRPQLIVLARSTERPCITRSDRALLIVQPATVKAETLRN